MGALDHHRTHEGTAFKTKHLVFKGGKVEYAGDCDVVGTAQNLLPASFVTKSDSFPFFDFRTFGINSF